ncbi:hypothetical protein Taro_026339 [Colocasia esculenta]|uniref:Pectate lyase n=1 Tax=Colocasia esculenta TaxID=4460 RepID=A0A843VJA1_COLES|nr:hypothetical protein [Colocasia esculenta]
MGGRCASGKPGRRANAGSPPRHHHSVVGPPHNHPPGALAPQPRPPPPTPPPDPLPSTPAPPHSAPSGKGMAALPYARVDGSLRALAGQAEGFGRCAIGGLHGPVYHVTTLAGTSFLFLRSAVPQVVGPVISSFIHADDGLGSLREGCRRKEPLWIVFEISGTINLSSYLRVSSYKTIDGRGQRIKITGKGLQLKECEHIIVCNLEFEGGRGHDVDGIQIKPKSKHIWIDRCTLCDYDDGLIDITRQSTDITVSRCHFAMHDKTMLIGADCTHSDDRCIRVTIHHCFFDGTRQRHPRVRFAKVHLYNNYTRNWGIYAVCSSVESQILSQCNIYEAGQKKEVFRYMTEKAPDREVAACGSIRSEGDLFMNGAQPCLLSGATTESVFRASEFYPAWTLEPASEALKQVLQVCSGWQAISSPADIVPARDVAVFMNITGTVRSGEHLECHKSFLVIASQIVVVVVLASVM